MRGKVSREMESDVAQLLSPDRLLAAIVESSDDAIVSKSLNGIIQSWNLAAERIFGYTAGQAVGKHISLIIPEERLLEEDGIVARLRAGERIEHFETLRKHRDGHLFPVSLTISPIRDDQGRVVGASKIARDISERRRAEEAIREINRRKDEFLATLSHELRNPLAPIRAGMELVQLEATASGNANLQETSAMVDRQLRHMVHLLEDLLDVARISSDKLELHRVPVTIASIIQSAGEASVPLIQAGGHALRIEAPEQPVYVNADPMRLAQVLSNLLNNAAKYSLTGGRIDLRVQLVSDWVEIRVRDEGLGIAAADLPSVFEMFWQARGPDGQRRDGLGIGLAIARALMQLHGGSIEARSDGPGRGSEFIMRMPALPADAAETRVPDAQPDAARRRVLIVDDVPDAAESLGRLLSTLGHEVALSYNGIDGVAAARRLHPEVMLVDIGMPGMNGHEVCKRVREQPEGDSIFMIALTGFGQQSDRAATRESGFNLHLVKPVDGEALSQLISSVPRREGGIPERQAAAGRP